MRNYRFKLSDMIPNAWFYKLKDMGKGRNINNKNTTLSTKKKNQTPSSASSSSTNTTTTTQSPKPKHQPHNQNCTPRKSYYFTRELVNNNNNNQSSSKIHHTSPPQEPPRKSSSPRQRRRKRRATITTTSPRVSISSPKLVNSSVVSSSGCSCRTTLESVWTKSTDSPPESSSPTSSSSPFDDDDAQSPEPEFIRRTDCALPIESSSSTTFDEMISLSTNTNTDIVIDVDKNSLATRRNDDKLDGYDSFSDLDLPPILTKPTTKEEDPNKNKGSLKLKIVKEQSKQSKEQSKEESKQRKEQSKQSKQRNNNTTNASNVRGFSVSSPGLKVKINSPKLGRKILQPAAHGRRSVSSAASGGRRSLSGSFAVVKSSFNPTKDFKESMVEMIEENNIRESKDLEDLLACYLSLNSDEYHEVIITVFKQVWFDLTQKR